jgi:Fe-S-cluster-containing dehydrogenase component
MGISRRKFLKSITAASGASLIGKSQLANGAGNFAGYPDRFGVLTDLTRCVGCRSCEVACNQVNKLPPPEVPFEDQSVFEKTRRTTEKAYTVVNRYPNPDPDGPPVFVKQQCRHCDEPACATACPFHVPAYEYDDPFSPEIKKCTMCYDTRISKGGIPGCVEACPMEAMTFGKRSDLIKVARKRIVEHPDKYVDHIYGEHEVGGTCWMYISGVPFEKVGFDMNLPTKPYPELTRGFLTMVPAVLVIWPALLGGFYMFTQHRDEMDEEEAEFTEKKEN